MPSPSTITDDDKDKIKAVVPTKVLSATLARIYYAHPQPNKWSYTGLQGALVFNYDRSDDTFHFKMVDLEGTGGLLWKHELYQNLEYNVENKFFHSFEGDVSCVQPLTLNIGLTVLAMYDRFYLCK